MSNRTKIPAGTRKSPIRKLPAWARKDVEDVIERLLGVLDKLDGDPDIEDGDPAEDDGTAEDGDEDVDIVDQPHDQPAKDIVAADRVPKQPIQVEFCQREFLL